MTFNPVGNEDIHLAGYTYRVRAHGGPGALASRPIRVVGGRAQVYQLIEVDTGDIFAFKVMLPAFRMPQLLRNTGLLKQLAPHHGFEACRQLYITPQSHLEDVTRYPDLAYASLMPWIQGQDWKAIIGNPEATIDADTSWELAYQLARLVRMLERNHIAHCDLSGGNIMVNLDSRRVTLIDFDEVYWPSAPVPAVLPTGTPGYRRRVQSQWVEGSDRFPTAVLVAEMLGWRDAALRHTSSGDSFFTDEDCLGMYSDKYRLLEEFMYGLHSELGDLLKRAWLAPSPMECPAADEWRLAIMRARGWRAIPLDPLDRARIDLSLLPRAAAPVPSTAAPAPTTAPTAPATTPTIHQGDRQESHPPIPYEPTQKPPIAPGSNAAVPLSGGGIGRRKDAQDEETRRDQSSRMSNKDRRMKLPRLRRNFDLANSIVIGIVILSIGALLIGMFFLIFGGR